MFFGCGFSLLIDSRWFNLLRRTRFEVSGTSSVGGLVCLSQVLEALARFLPRHCSAPFPTSPFSDPFLRGRGRPLHRGPHVSYARSCVFIRSFSRSPGVPGSCRSKCKSHLEKSVWGPGPSAPLVKWAKGPLTTRSHRTLREQQPAQNNKENGTGKMTESNKTQNTAG